MLSTFVARTICPAPTTPRRLTLCTAAIGLEEKNLDVCLVGNGCFHNVGLIIMLKMLKVKHGVSLPSLLSRAALLLSPFVLPRLAGHARKFPRPNAINHTRRVCRLRASAKKRAEALHAYNGVLTGRESCERCGRSRSSSLCVKSCHRCKLCYPYASILLTRS